MGTKGWTGPERRRHARIDVAYEIRFQVLVGQKGSKPVTGTTVNLSRGGLLAKVDQTIALAARCQVHFIGVADRIRPQKVSGVVRRVSRARHAHLVAIQFDEPLEHLLVADTAWVKPKLKM